MNTNYEDWNAKEWLECLVLRDKVLAGYFAALKKYNGLPACEELVERELLKKYDEDTLDLTLGAITPPLTYIIHEWDKATNPEFAEDGEDEDAEDDGVKSNGKLSTDDDKVLGETCYSGIVDIIGRWIECVKKPKPADSAKLMLSVLCSLSTVGNYIFSCAYSKHFQQDARVCGLIQVSINKCILVSQCLKAFASGCNDYNELSTGLADVINRLILLQSVLREYLSEVITPRNRQ